MNVGFVLAAYKEELNLKELLNSIFSNVDNPKIVIVDDSPENLVKNILSEFKDITYIHRGKKLGRGSAVLRGMKEILNFKNIDIIIEIDTDLSHDPNEIPKNIKKFKKEELDLLISGRYLKESKILNWTIDRRILSFSANFLAKSFLKVPVSDYTNAFRIYSNRAAKHIVQNCGSIGDGFIILSEILVELYYNNFKVGETQTVWKNRVRGKSTVSFKEIFQSLIGLIKIYEKKNKIKKSRKL